MVSKGISGGLDELAWSDDSSHIRHTFGMSGSRLDRQEFNLLKYTDPLDSRSRSTPKTPLTGREFSKVLTDSAHQMAFYT